MWRNYLVTAWRFLLADRAFTFVNLLGLSVGLAATILLALHVAGAIGADRWLADGERLFRVDTLETMPGREPLDIALAPGPLAPALRAAFPEVEAVTRLHVAEATVLQGGRRIAQRLVVADSNAFQLLRLPFVAGSGATALREPSAVALSVRAAERLFGTRDAVGRRLTLLLPRARDFTVSAVFETVPERSHLALDVVVPAAAYFGAADAETATIPDGWGGAYFHTYVRLREPADAAAVERGLPALVDRSVPAWMTGALAIPPREFYRFRLVPVADIGFDGGAIAAMKPGQSRATLAALSAVALLILLVAAVNFANLAAARSTLRAREVALRKAVGARRAQIVAQFLGEALLMTIVAALIGLSLAELAAPYASALVGAEQGLAPGGGWRFWSGVALAVLVTGIVSGAYPALVASRIRPAAMLSGGHGAAAPGGRLREALMVLQFAVAIGLVAVTAVMVEQMRFTARAPLGFDPERLVVLRMPEGEEHRARALSLREALLRTPGIEAAAFSSAVPGEASEDNLSVDLPGAAKPLQLGFHRVDPAFFATYGAAPLIGHADAGRRSGGADGGAVLVNQAAVERLGLGSDTAAVGAELRSGARRFTVAGVVPDMRFRSLHEPVRDEIYILSDAAERSLTLRLAPGAGAAALAAIDKAWRARFPGRAVERAFLADRLELLYAAERRQARLLALFAGLAVLLSCLGLVAMAAFAVRRSRREIAMRKLLGARNADLRRLLLWRFLRPVAAANLIAWPAAWWAMRSWLDRFDQRIELGPAPFLAAAGLAAALAALAVLAHAARVARASPIHALRYE